MSGNEDAKEKRLRELKGIIQQHVLIRGDEKPIFREGEAWTTHDAFVFDFRNILLQPQYLDLISEMFWDEYESQYPFQVGGLETASIPLIAAIVMKSKEKGKPVNGFYIRKSRKKYDLVKMIEGKITADPVILIDDLTNNGYSFLRQIELLEKTQTKVTDIFTLLRFREEKQYAHITEKYGVHMSSFFTLPDFGIQFIEEKKKTLSDTFDPKWCFESEDPNYFYVVSKSAPVVDEERVYFGSDSGNFWALNQKDGTVSWKYKVGPHALGKSIFSSPALHEGTVYFGSYDGNVYALSAETGKPKWKFMEADWIGSSPALAPNLGLLFIGLEFGLMRKRGGIAALDMKTGKKMWEERTPELTHSSPAYSKGLNVVFIGSNDGKAYLYTPKEGKLLWEFQTGDDIKESAVYDEKNGNVIFGSMDGNIYCINCKTGNPVYKFETHAGIYSTPLLHKGRIYVGSLDKILYCVDSTNGNLEWKFETSGRIFSSPIIIDNLLYIGSNDGRLYEVDINTGKRVNVFQTTERIVNKIAYNKKTKQFFVPTFANQIFCLEKKGEE